MNHPSHGLDLVFSASNSDSKRFKWITLGPKTNPQWSTIKQIKMTFMSHLDYKNESRDSQDPVLFCETWCSMIEFLFVLICYYKWKMLTWMILRLSPFVYPFSLGVSTWLLKISLSKTETERHGKTLRFV